MADESTSDGSERRAEERLSAKFEVRFAQTDDAARALRAYSLNFSPGGLCLKTRRTYEVGTPLDLAVTIGGQSFELFGVVAWVKGGAIGVRFEDLEPEIRDRLEALTATLRKVS